MGTKHILCQLNLPRGTKNCLRYDSKVHFTSELKKANDDSSHRLCAKLKIRKQTCSTRPILNMTSSTKQETHNITRYRARRRRFEAFTTERQNYSTADSSTRRAFFRRLPRDSFSTAIATRLTTAWLINLSISLKHGGTASRLGLSDCSLSGQTFLLLTMLNRIIAS